MFGALAKLLRGQDTAPNPRILGATTLRRLFWFYTVVGSVVIALHLAAPLAPSGDGRTMSPWLAGQFGYSVNEPPIIPPWLDAALAMTGACLLAIPLGFVYIRTRTRQKYDESLVSTVIVLPPLVTAILVVVQNSLALAFSLAGIVAAVRFRNTLKESRDAVYIMAAVGIGFAAGVYALDVALVVSFGFAVLELLTWKANLTRDHGQVMEVLCLPGRPLKLPDTPAGTPAMIGDDLGNGPTGHSRLGGSPSPDVDDNEPDQKKPAKQATLRVQVSDIDDGRATTEAVLTRMTKKWELLSTTGGGQPHLVLEYQVRLRKRFPVDQVLDALYKEGKPFVVTAESAS